MSRLSKTDARENVIITLDLVMLSNTKEPTQDAESIFGLLAHGIAVLARGKLHYLLELAGESRGAGIA